MLGEHQHRFNESGTGLQQRFQLAALAELIQPADSAQNPLARLAVLPAAGLGQEPKDLQ